MAPSVAAGHTKRANMPQKRRAAAPLPRKTAASTAKNLTDEVRPHSTFHADVASITGRLAAYTAEEYVDADTGDRRIRVRPFMTLKSAENAVRAAWDRGHRAEVVVVHLTAVRIGGL